MNEQLNNNTINTQPEINQNPQIEQQPVQPQYNQPNNNKKSNNTLVILLVIVVLALVAALIFVMMNKKDSSNDKDTNKENNTIENTNDNQTTDNTTEAKEVELSNPESYRYLIDRLGGGLPKNNNRLSIDIAEYLNFSNISDEFKIMNALKNLTSQQITINSKDEIYYDGKKDSNSITNSQSYEGYKVSDVENEIKKIYGKNTNVDYKKVPSPYAYDETNNYFFLLGGYGSTSNTTMQNIDKVTSMGNKLYIYVNVGMYTYSFENKEYIVYFDYKKDANSIKESNIDKKYFTTTDTSHYFESDKYIKDNKDKFTKYKYTFEKEENNYIIKGLEKIN